MPCPWARWRVTSAQSCASLRGPTEADLAAWEAGQLAKGQPFAAWKRHSAEMRSRHRIAKTSAPWTKWPVDVVLRGVPDMPRPTDLLGIGWAVE
eukprot:6027648-Pyramimonas_sp.AAC.1